MKYWEVIFFTVMLLPLCGCSNTFEANRLGSDEPVVLEEIAYDVNQDFGYTVFLYENGQYVPYLVLTNNYNHACLLLRERLLEETRIYNGPGWQASYYEDSDIDRFLNNEFLPTLSDNVASLILDSRIEITEKESIGVCGKTVTSILRKVFLLSFTETGARKSRTSLSEGKPLTYFYDANQRIALSQDGTPGSWWLRTPNTGALLAVCGVATDGTAGIGGIYNPNGGYFNGVRPAFCLPRETKIERTELDGMSAFVIAEAQTSGEERTIEP